MGYWRKAFVPSFTGVPWSAVNAKNCFRINGSQRQDSSVSNSQRGRSCEQIFDSSTTFLNPLVGTNSLYGKRTVGFLSLASHARRACEARDLRARKTLMPRFTDFFTDFEKKTDCFCFLVCVIKSRSPKSSIAGLITLRNHSTESELAGLFSGERRQTRRERRA